MIRPTALQTRILAFLRAGERGDIELYQAMKPTPVGTVHRALLALRNEDKVLARNCGTRVRLR